MSAVLLALLLATRSDPASAGAEPPALPTTSGEELRARVISAPRTAAERADYLTALWMQAGAAPDAIELQPVLPLVEGRIAAFRAKLVRATSGPAFPPPVRQALLNLESKALQEIPANRIVRIPGSSERTLVLGAHCDVDGRSPGRLDNASGCVLLADLYARLRAQTPRHTLVFVGFTGQRLGHLGAQAFVSSLDPDARSRVTAAIVLESLGSGDLSMWWEVSSVSIAEVAAEVARRRGQAFTAWSFEAPGGDARPFRQEKMSVLHLQGLAPASVARIGTEGDDGSDLDPARLEQALEFLLALVRELDDLEGPPRLSDVKARFQLDESAGWKPLAPVPLATLLGPPP